MALQTPMSSTAITTKKKPLKSAPVPWHSPVTLVIFLAGFVYVFPSLESLDQEVAHYETFTDVLFPNSHVSTTTVAIIRLLFACIIIADCLYAIFYGEWDQSYRLLQTPLHIDFH